MFIEYRVLMTRLKIYTLKMLKIYNKDTRTTSVKVILVPLLLNLNMLKTSIYTQSALTYSKPTMETPKQCKKYS